MLYIPKIKLDQTSQSVYFSRKKCYPEISSLCPFNMPEAGMCILKKTEYSINEIVFLVLIPNIYIFMDMDM